MINSPHKTSAELVSIARDATSDYITNGTPLTEAVVKAASASHPLTSEHVRRICEMTYHDAYERLFAEKTGAHQYVSFDPPDAIKAAEMLDARQISGDPMNKTASAPAVARLVKHDPKIKVNHAMQAAKTPKQKRDVLKNLREMKKEAAKKKSMFARFKRGIKIQRLDPSELSKSELQQEKRRLLDMQRQRESTSGRVQGNLANLESAGGGASLGLLTAHRLGVKNPMGMAAAGALGGLGGYKLHRYLSDKAEDHQEQRLLGIRKALGEGVKVANIEKAKDLMSQRGISASEALKEVYPTMSEKKIQEIAASLGDEERSPEVVKQAGLFSGYSDAEKRKLAIAAMLSSGGLIASRPSTSVNTKIKGGAAQIGAMALAGQALKSRKKREEAQKTASMPKEFTPLNKFDLHIRKEASQPNWHNPTRELEETHRALRDSIKTVKADLYSAEQAEKMAMVEMVKQANAGLSAGFSMEQILHAGLSAVDVSSSFMAKEAHDLCSHIAQACAGHQNSGFTKEAKMFMSPREGMAKARENSKGWRKNPMKLLYNFDAHKKTASGFGQVNPDHPIPTKFSKLANSRIERKHLEVTLDELSRNLDYFNEQLRTL